ncbi:MAG: alpha-glucosidase [Erysipelotrichaceae bacterium]|nr:alpha-glucosidase [Erysipelotrichaceae bacterium]
MEININTKLKEVIKTPVGHDVIARVLYSIGFDENLLKGLLGSLRIRDIKTLSLGKLDDEFIESLLTLLNSQTEIIEENDECAIKREWWKEAVFYEIYPRSFKDSNNDGIGDIPGIISKLDYLKDLGVNALWICPFYDSPNADNGYDIRDYKKIMKEFGEMEDLDNLLKEAHQRDIKVIVDLVMNHTSDEHEFFKKALAGEKKYEDYYIFRDKPNNWTSLFSGTAWNYIEEKKKYVLHLFAKKQIDLNWDNPEVREEMYDIATYWLNKGADGFRLDVVSFISKNYGLPDGNDKLAKLIGFRGIEHYFHGPNLDKYLKEFNERVLSKYNAYTVGECPGNGLKMARLITGDDRRELSQLFSFDHIENPGQKRYDVYDFDLRKMIPELVRWQEGYTNHCWPTLFFDNHDNPRMISKIDHTNTYRIPLAKLLATLMFTLKGTPYLYQGEEIGMVNHDFKSIDEIRDVEALQFYQDGIDNGVDVIKEFKRIQYGSRDHARTPMCWSNELYGGFSDVKPWIDINDYGDINVEKELSDKNSILNFHKDLIRYRKEHKALIYGSFKQLKSNKNIFIYERELEDEKYLIVMNLTDKVQRYPNIKGELLFSNYGDTTVLKAYQADIYKLCVDATK